VLIFFTYLKNLHVCKIKLLQISLLLLLYQTLETVLIFCNLFSSCLSTTGRSLCQVNNYNENQCSGPPGSTCFLASRIRIHLSEVWIRILLSSSKKSKKNLDSYCLVTSFRLFIFENDVNVPSKSNKQKNLLKISSFLLAS
jgi:hypothetical protein